MSSGHPSLLLRVKTDPFSAFINSLNPDNYFNLTMDRAVIISDALLTDFKCCEEAAIYLEYLRDSHSALLKIISETISDLSVTESVQYPLDTSSLARVDANGDVLMDDSTTQATHVYLNGRVMHECKECGKLHDRKGRVIACINSHSGSKPYKCNGECGKSAW